MAISVRDIKEKDFTAEKHGYKIEEVDDFLDEIADQVSELIKENLALRDQLKAAQEAPAPEPVVIEKESAPEFDDTGYFKNLETAMRDSLINAQRIAEETKKNAETAAAAAIEEARVRAETITAEARAEVENCKAEASTIREAVAKYRAEFRAMIQEQVKALKERDSFFD